VSGSGTSGSLNINNTLYVSGSSVGIGISNPTSSLEVNESISLRTKSGGTFTKLSFYTHQNQQWVIGTSSSLANRLAVFAPNASNIPTKIIELGDYIDNTPPNLVFAGGNAAIGYSHYWGINASLTAYYSSSFVVKQYESTPYVITVANSSDKVVSGFNSSGGAYFSGSVGIGTKSPSSPLHVLGTTNVATIQGSGSATPIFSVQGSLGQLFSVTDTLSGSLFSVNDISGLPVIDINSDSTVKLGSYLAPALYTTVKRTANTGVNIIYSIPTGSYDGAWYDYTIKSGSLARAGSIIAIWSGSSVNYTEASASSFGTTTTFVFGASILNGNLILSASAPTDNWTVKTIIRSI
jgi:hypothetical protein